MDLSAPTPAKPTISFRGFIRERYGTSKQLLLFFFGFTFACWHVIGIVIGTLWLGSILLGFIYNLLVI